MRYVAILFLVLIVVPMLNVVAISLSSKEAVREFKVSVFPVGFQTKAYEVILTSQVFFSSLYNTILITVVNTALTIVIALGAGYALANRDFIGNSLALIIL